jgi:hypothetical protein
VGDSGGGRGSALIARTTVREKPAEAARALFATASARPMTAAKTAGAVVAVAAAVVVGLLRQPGPGALNTVWAEDGSIFYAQAVDQGPWSALTTSYAGYFHAVPRLLAAIAAAVPPGAAAAVLAGGAALVVGLLAVLVYVASGAHLQSQVARVLVSALVVVVPVAQDEVLNSIANFHWYGLYVLFWVFLWSPRSRLAQVVAVLTVFLVATSDILVLAYLPLALFRAFTRTGSRKFGQVLAGALAIGLVVQFAGLASGSSERDVSPDPVRAAVGFVLRAVPAPLIGQRWLGHDVGARWIALAALAWLLVAVALVVALRGLTRPAWVLAGAAALQSAALYVLPVVLSGVAAPRYAVAPALLVVVALVALLQPKPGKPIPLYALAGFLTVIALVNLRIDNPRAHGPHWDAELDKARAACAPGGTAAIPIAPVETPPWLVQVRCENLN